MVLRPPMLQFVVGAGFCRPELVLAFVVLLRLTLCRSVRLRWMGTDYWDFLRVSGAHVGVDDIAFCLVSWVFEEKCMGVRDASLFMRVLGCCFFCRVGVVFVGGFGVFLFHGLWSFVFLRVASVLRIIDNGLVIWCLGCFGGFCRLVSGLRYGRWLACPAWLF